MVDDDVTRPSRRPSTMQFLGAVREVGLALAVWGALLWWQSFCGDGDEEVLFYKYKTNYFQVVVFRSLSHSRQRKSFFASAVLRRKVGFSTLSQEQTNKTPSTVANRFFSSSLRLTSSLCKYSTSAVVVPPAVQTSRPHDYDGLVLFDVCIAAFYSVTIAFYMTNKFAFE